MIHWTTALRAEVTPRTAADAGPAKSRERAFEALQKKRKKGKLDPILRRDSPSGESLDKALALIDGPAWPDAAPEMGPAQLLLSASRSCAEGDEIFALLESHGSTYVFQVFLQSTRAIDSAQIAMSWFTTAVRLRSAILREPVAEDMALEAWIASTEDRKILLATAFPDRPEWAAEVAARALKPPVSGYLPARQIFMSLRDPALAALLLSTASWVESFADVIETFGDDALAMILAYAPRAQWKTQRRAVAMGLSVFDSEDVAALFVKWLPKREVRVIATEWFARFPNLGHAALKSGKGRFALKILEQRERAGEAIDPATEATEDDLPEVLVSPPWKKRARGAPKPKITEPKRAPTLPKSWDAARFHRPRTTEGKPLPLAACDEIGRMLKMSTLGERWHGLDAIIPFCDRHSLAEFAWDIAQAWELGGKKKTELWMLHSLAHLADDEVTRRTTPAITDARIVDVLCTIGTDAAALELMTITMRESSMSHYAERALGDLAAARHMSKDALEDSLTPTLGLDEEGALSLDYGTQHHRVGFDTRLEPYVLSKNGDRLPNLPPKKKADDPEKVEEARRRWKDLKEDVATIAERRLDAAMRAMVEGRAWTLPELRRAWIDHPLMQHMARGILWLAKDVVFRVCEDRTFADEDDRPITVRDDAEVRVASHRQLSAGSIEKWRRVFDDYKILQPFDQLAVVSIE